MTNKKRIMSSMKTCWSSFTKSICLCWPIGTEIVYTVWVRSSGALVKRYILCKYAIDFSETHWLNRMLKGETAGYEPKKKVVFLVDEIKQYINRGITTGEELQDALLTMFSFFGLARSVEIDRNLVKFKKNGSVSFTLERCSKSKVLSKTKVVIPVLGSFIPVDTMIDHLELIPDGTRLWWKWNRHQEKFAAQHLGKGYVAKLVKKITSIKWPVDGMWRLDQRAGCSWILWRLRPHSWWTCCSHSGIWWTSNSRKSCDSYGDLPAT